MKKGDYMTQFRAMRRQRQQITDEQCVEILSHATSGVLALMGDDGYPYAVPLSYAYHDGCLIFHSAQAGHKVDAVRRCPKASFCVVEKDEVHPAAYTTYYRSVIAFGHIEVVEDDEQKRLFLHILGDRYYPNHADALSHEVEKGLARVLVIRMTIEHLTGKEAIELVHHAE